jgi:hypothetical protein
MQSQERDPGRDAMGGFLQGAVEAGQSSDEVAALVATTFRGIDLALSPIIGQQGMAALYKRCLHLSRPLHAWLPVDAEGSQGNVGAGAETNFAPLTAALAQRTSVDAAAAGTQLL